MKMYQVGTIFLFSLLCYRRRACMARRSRPPFPPRPRRIQGSMSSQHSAIGLGLFSRSSIWPHTQNLFPRGLMEPSVLHSISGQVSDSSLSS